MADLNGDGTLDMISGSYAPGDIYWFPRNAEGTFGARDVMRDKNGRELRCGKQSVAYASSTTAADWDGDGDIDLIIGNVSGQVFFARNEGDPRQPAFAKPVDLLPGGQAHGNGGDAGPCIADWDGDGVNDLLVGYGNGSVLWYRNTGTAKDAKLAAGQVLLPAANQLSGKGNAKTAWGTRTKVCVTDWNEDGRPDLLVGDFQSVSEPTTILVKTEDKATTDEARATYDEVMKRYREATKKTGLSDFGQQLVKLDNWPDDETAEQQKERETKRAAVREQIEKATEEMKPLTAELRAASEKMSRGTHSMHGYVWLFLRKGAPAAR